MYRAGAPARRRIAGLILVLSCIGALPARAALVERDLVAGSGDAHLTFDSGTGLEWLDVSLTTYRSFRDIAGGSGGWLDLGFHIATGAEVGALIASAGLAPNQHHTWNASVIGPQPSFNDVQRVQTLANLLGTTFRYEDEGSPTLRRSVLGYIADDYLTHPWYGNYGRYAEIGYYITPTWATAVATDGSGSQIYRDQRYAEFGTFLVRAAAPVTAVPEPSLPVLGAVSALALLGLRIARRRR